MRVAKLLLIAGLVAAVTLAAPPVGKVTSAKAFRLSGTEVAAEGVANWPLVSGDEIATLETPARVDLRDGSTVYLMARSRARISVEDQGIVVRLQAGALRYRLAENGRTLVAALDYEALPRQAREGRLVVENSEAYWNPANPDFYQVGAGIAVVESSSFTRRYRVTPFNLDFVTRWRQYEPGWGTPPGQPGAGTEPAVTPVGPSEPKPVSAYRP